MCDCVCVCGCAFVCVVLIGDMCHRALVGERLTASTTLPYFGNFGPKLLFHDLWVDSPYAKSKCGQVVAQTCVVVRCFGC